MIYYTIDMGTKYFRAFLAVLSGQIKESVIISPIIYPKRLEKTAGEKVKVHKSILGYLVSNYKDFTFVKTPMAQSAVADLFPLLKQTKCKHVIFIGAMGALPSDLKIGDIVHVRDLKLGDNIEIMVEGDAPIVTVAEPTVEETAAEKTAEAEAVAPAKPAPAQQPSTKS